MATSTEKVVDYGKWLSAQYGLTVTSHVRSPERNRAVGGAPNSDHLSGLGMDLAGDPAKMSSLAEWARANMGPGKMFRYVEYGTEDHQDHVHLSFNRDATIPTVDAPQGDDVTTLTAATTVDDRPDIAPDASPEEIEEYINTYYPDVAPFLGDPAIKMLLYAAAIHDWDDRKLDAAIEQTTYWQTHSAPSRAVDAFLSEAGNEEVERVIGRAQEIIGDLFARNGVTLDQAGLDRLSMAALRAGDITLQGQVANADGLNNLLADNLRTTPLKDGDIGVNAAALTQIARSYLIPVDDKTIRQWATRIIDGSATADTFRQYVAGLARGQWVNDKDVVGAIDSGLAPADFFAPHRNLIANRLEMTADQVDLTAARFREVTQFWDGKQRRSMTLGELDERIRGWVRAMPEQEQPRWWRDEKADKVSRVREWAGVA